jgi:hypothetical protein
VLDVRTTICTATVVAILFSLGFAAPQASAQTGTNVAVLDIPYIFKNFTRFKQAIDDIKKDIDEYKNVVNEPARSAAGRDPEAGTVQAGHEGVQGPVEEKIARCEAEFQLESAKRPEGVHGTRSPGVLHGLPRGGAVVADFAQRNRIGLVLRYSAEEMDPSNAIRSCKASTGSWSTRTG